MKVRVVLRVANSAAVSARSRAAYCTRQALTKPGGYGLPDVVMFSEVSPVNVALVAYHHAVGTSVVQHGVSGSPEAGVAIASRFPLTPLRPVLGSPATREGGGIRARPLVGARVGRLRVWSGHAPPPRAPIARAAYLARLYMVRGVIGLDSNREPGWMRRAFGRKWRGIGVLGLLIPRRFKPSRPWPVHIGSDHEAVDVLIKVPARLLKEKP